MAEACLALMMAGLTAYGLMAGADFGAGFWDLTAGGARGGGAMRGMIKRSMSPVWEANHVWLIFVFVIFWTAFPRAFGSVTSTLYVPLFGAVVGIVLRGTAFALRGEATTIGETRAFGAVFALSSLVTPFFMGTALGGIASGRVPVGNAAGDPISSWVNPTSLVVGALAVATGAYLSAVFLAGDSKRAELPDMVVAFQRRALGAGAVAGLLTLGGLAVLRSDAPRLFDGITSGPGLAAAGVSALAGAATLALMWLGRFFLARFTAGLAVVGVTAGWAFAQRPDLLPGALTLDQAAAGDATLSALLVAMAAGLVLLVPSLWLLYSLVLHGRLDQSSEPLDERVRS